MMINRIDEYAKMSEAEENHWWYKSLRDLVMKGIKNNFYDNNITIIDAGCGTGGTMKYLLREGYNNTSGIDVSEHAVDICLAKHLPAARCDMKNIKKKYTTGSADVIICNDVLYFFTEDERRAIIKDIHEILKVNGILIMNLPAMKIFRGVHDRAVGIGSRFSNEDVVRLFDNHHFKIMKKMYWPFLLSPVIYAVRLVQRMKLQLFHNTIITSDLTIPNKIVNELLYQIVLFENFLLNVKPFGSSIFLIARKE